jgi:hypothetical protein
LELQNQVDKTSKEITDKNIKIEQLNTSLANNLAKIENINNIKEEEIKILINTNQTSKK